MAMLVKRSVTFSDLEGAKGVKDITISCTSTPVHTIRYGTTWHKMVKKEMGWVGQELKYVKWNKAKQLNCNAWQYTKYNAIYLSRDMTSKERKYHVISYHIISYHIISYHIMSCHVISYHDMSCRYLEPISPKIDRVQDWTQARAINTLWLEIGRERERRWEIILENIKTWTQSIIYFKKEVRRYVQGKCL